MDCKTEWFSVIEKIKRIHDDYSKSVDWWDEISTAEKNQLSEA